jgi:hypothetical protein
MDFIACFPYSADRTSLTCCIIYALQARRGAVVDAFLSKLNAIRKLLESQEQHMATGKNAARRS